jgi:hypothetical protein
VISDFDPSNWLSTYRWRNRFFIDNIVSWSFRLNCNLQIIAVPAWWTVDWKIHVVVDAH